MARSDSTVLTVIGAGVQGVTQAGAGWGGGAKVGRRVLDAVVRASGRIEADERRLATATAKFEGYIEKLHVNATGQLVRQGEPLFDAYSPDLLAAQREYEVAVQGLAQLKDVDAQARAGLWMALHYVPIALLALSFRLQEMSQFEIPRWPRKPRPRSRSTKKKTFGASLS